MKTKQLLKELWNREKFIIGIVIGFFLSEFMMLIILLIMMYSIKSGLCT